MAEVDERVPRTEAGRGTLELNPERAIEFWPVLHIAIAAIEAEAIALRDAELAAAVREHNQGKTLHPEMTVDCVARAAVLRFIEGKKGADHAD